MHKKKLNILLLILSLGLYLGLSSISYTMAYSFDEFVEFCQYTKNMNINSASTSINNIRNNIATTTIDIKQFATNKGYNLDNYNSFIVASPPAGYSIAFYCTSDPVSYTINTNNQISVSGANWNRFYLNSVTSGGGGPSSSPGTSDNYIGLINSNPTDNNYRNAIMQNRWNYINILSGRDFKLSTLPWYFADVFICQANSSSSIYLYHNGEPVGNLQTISSSVNGGTLYQVEIIDTYGLENNSNYSLKLYSGNDLLVSSEDFNITWQNDLSPDPGDSGDSGGSGSCDCVPYLVEILGVISGDVLKAIDNNGNVIVGTLGELKQQLEDNNHILDDIKSGLFGSGDSGDGILGGTTLESGDEPTLEDLASITIDDEDDPSHEFFTWLLNEIIDVLEDDTEQTLEIPIYNTTYYISSDIFKLEIEPLKTFIQCGWWFIVGVPFLKYIRSCIEKLKGGEIPASDEKSDLLGNVL